MTTIVKRYNRYFYYLIIFENRLRAKILSRISVYDISTDINRVGYFALNEIATARDPNRFISKTVLFGGGFSGCGQKSLEYTSRCRLSGEFNVSKTNKTTFPPKDDDREYFSSKCYAIKYDNVVKIN